MRSATLPQVRLFDDAGVGLADNRRLSFILLTESLFAIVIALLALWNGPVGYSWFVWRVLYWSFSYRRILPLKCLPGKRVKCCNRRVRVRECGRVFFLIACVENCGAVRFGGRGRYCPLFLFPGKNSKNAQMIYTRVADTNAVKH